jgi:long-chain acyl-CoA synthetase
MNMNLSKAGAKPWYERTDLRDTWLSDVIQNEMKQLRPSYQKPEWQEATKLNSAEADIDSIELVDIASNLYLLLNADGTGALDRGKLGRSFAEWSSFVELAASLEPSMGFFSSGTSGNRSLHRHSYCALNSEITALLNVFPHLRKAKRVVNTVSTAHIYGFLFGTLFPAQLNVVSVGVGLPSPAVIRHLLRPGDVCVATPKLLQQLHQEQRALVTDVVFLSAGMRFPDQLFAGLREIGAAQLIDLYGSTETAGLGFRDQAGPFQLSARYERSAEQLRDLENAMCLTEVPDALRWEDARRFSVGERSDQQVQISGVNVSIPYVVSILVKQSCVISAEVYLLGKSTQARLAARLRVTQGFDLARLKQALSAQLKSAELPIEFDIDLE